ncbi:MAG: SDR family NAD(P)-dependent oxidoreductase [Spirochaetales bacterium]
MRNAEFLAKYGPWAVVLGASRGLGKAYARELAVRGLNVVLVARSKQPLEEVAADLEDRGAEALVIAKDLSAPDAIEELSKDTSHIEVGLVVINAALAPTGPLLDDERTKLELAVTLNCAASLRAVHCFGNRLAQHRRGGIVIMSSLAGMQGSPKIATYAATKAFLLVLGESMWGELREQGVDVLVCAPGAVATPGFLAGGTEGAKKLGPIVMAPEKVVSGALRRLPRGGTYVPGVLNKLGRWALGHLVPRRVAVRIMGRVGSLLTR